MASKISIHKDKALSGHKGSIYVLKQSKKASNKFISAGGDGMVIEWDLDNTNKAKLLAKVDINIFSLAELPNKEVLLIGQLQGGIHVIDGKLQKEIKHLALHKKGVFAIELLDDNTFIAAGGDGLLSVWSATDFTLLKTIKISDSSLRSISISPNGQKLAIACSDNNIYILDILNIDGKYQFKLKHTLSQHNNSVFTAVFSPNGNYLISGSRDAHICVWDVAKNYHLCHTVAAHLFTINHIVFSPDGRFFATAGRDKAFKVWDANSFELLKVISPEKGDAHINSVNCLLWTEYNNTLISAGDDRNIMLWNIIE